MRSRLLVIALSVSPLLVAGANRIPIGKLLDEMVHRSTLVEPGSKPFYLNATITDKDDSESEFNGTVEEYWVSPTKWRRVIKLRDFSQTRIVNGDAVYEENTGEYFPVHDEMLANEIVDPLPKSAVDLLTRLDFTASEPGSGQGQCMAGKQFTDEDGQKPRVVVAYDCQTGLLMYLWSPSCCYGVMTDYRKFHNKMIAYATKDNPINIQIHTLKDFNDKDEKLFAISQPTPADKRMTTEKLSEAKARALLLSKTEIQWPSARKTRDNTMTVELVIGRDGRVKEAATYSPVDNGVEDAALSAIRKWTFKPQTVDGIPAQISTSFLIPFPSEYLAANAARTDVIPIFAKMRASSDLRMNGAPSFHMKASFQWDGGAGRGAYEETWVSPTKWRREVRVNDDSLIEARRDLVFYRTFAGKYGPRLADDVIDFLAFNFPGENGSEVTAVNWNTLKTNQDNVPVMRLSNGHIDAQGKPDGLTVMYFVDEQTDLIRGRSHGSMQASFDDFEPFGEKSVPRKLRLQGDDVNTMEITIDTLEPARNVSDELFNIAGAKLAYTSGEDQRFTQPLAIFTPPIHVSGFHGDAMCTLTIDERGHVRDVDVKGTTDEAVIKSIRSALMTWEYEPGTMNGHPSISFGRVQLTEK
jgi:TonB family protein